MDLFIYEIIEKEIWLGSGFLNQSHPTLFCSKKMELHNITSKMIQHKNSSEMPKIPFWKQYATTYTFPTLTFQETKRILSISLEMERSPFSLFRGYNCPKQSCSKIKWTPFKYTKWFLSISSEMERIPPPPPPPQKNCL
jgi:hypothetical protein